MQATIAMQREAPCVALMQSLNARVAHRKRNSLRSRLRMAGSKSRTAERARSFEAPSSRSR